MIFGLVLGQKTQFWHHSGSHRWIRVAQSLEHSTRYTRLSSLERLFFSTYIITNEKSYGHFSLYPHLWWKATLWYARWKEKVSITKRKCKELKIKTKNLIFPFLSSKIVIFIFPSFFSPSFSTHLGPLQISFNSWSLSLLLFASFRLYHQHVILLRN